MDHRAGEEVESEAKTVQKWREQGRGPEYRDEAGIRYPLHLYLAWRERGLLRSTKDGRRTRG